MKINKTICDRCTTEMTDQTDVSGNMGDCEKNNLFYLLSNLKIDLCASCFDGLFDKIKSKIFNYCEGTGFI